MHDNDCVTEPARDVYRVPGKSRPSACVIFATKGRADTLSEAVGTLAYQTLQPSMIIVSATSKSDVGALAARSDIRVLTEASGLTNQRNAALRIVPAHIDFVVFFDDDFVPHAGWLEAVGAVFELHPDIGGITGNLVGDGAPGKEIPFDESLTILSSVRRGDTEWIRDYENPYGCNMAFRRSAIEGLEFDERLVLVGWLEDRDFGARLAQRGSRLVKVGAALGVHRGVKKSKGSECSLGYAQVVNTVYLHRKGTMTSLNLIKHLLKQVLSNLFWSWHRASHIDRFGRLRGNLLGLRDVLNRRIMPEHAARL